ncbi:MAG: energy transducer TonB [Pseudomonadota bacterium]
MSAVAQSSAEAAGIEAYYKQHPEMRPEALRLAKTPVSGKAHAQGVCVRPEYPKKALREEHQGSVELEFLIDLDGSVADSMIRKSSGHALLDAAAVKALSKCKFRPGTKDGKPARTWQSVGYDFSLK